MSPRRSLGEFLRRLRKSKKKTQRSLADEVGVDHTYLSKLENDSPGFENISERTLLRLAGALDADADELIVRAGKVPSDVQRILIEDFSLIKKIRDSQAPTAPAGAENKADSAGGEDE